MKIPKWHDRYDNLENVAVNVQKMYEKIKKLWNDNCYVPFSDVDDYKGYIYQYFRECNDLFIKKQTKKNVSIIYNKYINVSDMYIKDYPLLIFDVCENLSLIAKAANDTKTLNKLGRKLISDYSELVTGQTLFEIYLWTDNKRLKNKIDEFSPQLIIIEKNLSKMELPFKEEILSYIHLAYKNLTSKEEGLYGYLFYSLIYVDDYFISGTEDSLYVKVKYPTQVEINLNNVRALIKEASNLWRKENNLPLRGEMWNSETLLYRLIKDIYPQYDVLFHAMPEFIDPQHFDIFIPKLSLALEYQGIQHFKPVEKFGGKERLESNIRRDKIKRKKARENNVTVIDVLPDYDIKNLVKKIAKITKTPVANIPQNLNIKGKKEEIKLKKKRFLDLYSQKIEK